METQVKGTVQSSQGNMTTEKWIRNYLNEDYLKGPEDVETTFGKMKKIKEHQACFVFTPIKTRGDNGVMLTEFLGIADLKEVLLEFEVGFNRDIAVYPMGIPRNSFIIHNEVSTMMIGQVWRKYRTIEPDKKWNLLATFNVMQAFFYQASLNTDKSATFLKYLKLIFENVCPKIIEMGNDMRQYIYGEANDLQSHDVLHTSLALAMVQALMPSEYKQINKNQLIGSLMKKNLERMMRYSKLSPNTDLTKFTAHYTLFIFSPLVIEFLTKNKTSDETLKSYNKIITDMQNEQKPLKYGLQQFKVVMKYSKFNEFVPAKESTNIWIEKVGGRNDNFEPVYFPKEESKANNGSGLGKKRERDQDPEQAESTSSKRPRYNDDTDQIDTYEGVNFQFTKPFRIFSKSIGTVPVLQSTFSSSWGYLVLPDEGFYKIILQSTLNSNFYGKDIYNREDALISQCIVYFAQKHIKDFIKNREEDTFNVSGVWYQQQKNQYTQVQPLKHNSTKNIEFYIVFYKNQIYIVQDNLLYIKLVPKKQNGTMHLGIQGQNCLAIMHRSEVSDDDIKHLERIDTKDLTCSICMDKIKNPEELKCEHQFCRECIRSWKATQNVCPICRSEI